MKLTTYHSFKKAPRQAIAVLLLCCFTSFITGCTSTATLKAPCPNYGASCAKKPINSWDYHAV